MLNLDAAADFDPDSAEIQGVLAAIAPIAGVSRVVAAAGNIVRALGIALDLAELESSEA